MHLSSLEAQAFGSGQAPAFGSSRHPFGVLSQQQLTRENVGIYGESCTHPGSESGAGEMLYAVGCVAP